MPGHVQRVRGGMGGGPHIGGGLGVLPAPTMSSGSLRSTHSTPSTRHVVLTAGSARRKSWRLSGALRRGGGSRMAAGMLGMKEPSSNCAAHRAWGGGEIWGARAGDRGRHWERDIGRHWERAIGRHWDP